MKYVRPISCGESMLDRSAKFCIFPMFDLWIKNIFIQRPCHEQMFERSANIANQALKGAGGLRTTKNVTVLMAHFL